VYAIVQFDPNLLTLADLGYVILQGAMIVTGVIILANRPGNLVGRLVLAAGVSFAMSWILFVPAVILLQRSHIYLAWSRPLPMRPAVSGCRCSLQP